MLAEPIAHDTTIKLNMSHNISTAKMQEVRFDLTQTIGSIKEQVEKRYGSDPNFVQLILRDKQGNFVSNMTNDVKFLGSYNPEEGYEIHVIDSNPNSVLKGLEDINQVPKYVMKDEDYDKLPNTMRKFKQQYLQQQAAGGNIVENPIDDTYQEAEALLIAIGSRCKLINGDHRGTVRYVGQVPQMGLGFFVGVQLDEPYGSGNGIIAGHMYFQCPNKYGEFLRPKDIEVGDFPELEIDEL